MILKNAAYGATVTSGGTNLHCLVLPKFRKVRVCDGELPTVKPIATAVRTVWKLLCAETRFGLAAEGTSAKSSSCLASHGYSPRTPFPRIPFLGILSPRAPYHRPPFHGLPFLGILFSKAPYPGHPSIGHTPMGHTE